MILTAFRSWPGAAIWATASGTRESVPGSLSADIDVVSVQAPTSISAASAWKAFLKHMVFSPLCLSFVVPDTLASVGDHINSPRTKQLLALLFCARLIQESQVLLIAAWNYVQEKLLFHNDLMIWVRLLRKYPCANGNDNSDETSHMKCHLRVDLPAQEPGIRVI
jgi:hypothetical protein